MNLTSPLAAALLLAASMPGTAALRPADNQVGQAPGAYKPTDQDIQEMYEFDFALAEPHMYELAHILSKDEASANEVWRRLSNKEDWKTLAAAVSTDAATKDKGGQIAGWHGANEFVPDFARAVKESKIGAFSKPVRTPFGWSIVKVLQRRPFTAKPLADMRPMLTETLKRYMAEVDAKKDDPAKLVAYFDGKVPPAPVLRRLLELRVPVDIRSSEGRTALHVACISGLLRESELLVKAGAPIDGADNKGNTPLDCAAYSDKSGQLAAMLLAHGASPKGDGTATLAPIHMAAFSDNSEVIRLLVKAGVDVDQRNKDQWTPLMFAASMGAPRAASALLACGANPLLTRTDPTPKDPKAERTALDIALLSAPIPTPMDYEAAQTILRQASEAAVLARSRATLKAFIVQDGRRAEISGGVVHLSRKPFSFEFLMQGTKGVKVAVVDQSGAGASWERLGPKVREGLPDFARTFFEDPKTPLLFVQSPDDPRPGSQGWFKSADSSAFTTFQESGGGFIATRAVESLELLPATDPVKRGVEKYRTLHLPAEGPLPPLLVAVAVVEPVGRFSNALRQVAFAEIRWDR